jgi:hypothetical protein
MNVSAQISMITLYIVASVYGQIPTANLAATAAGGSGYAINNTLGNTTSAYSTLMSWLPIIAVVLAAAIVLGLLLHDLFGTGRSG